MDTIGIDDDKSPVETISDDTACNPEIKVEGENLTSVLNSWLEKLPDKQREVLARRFGLLNHEEETLEQVGREIGLTRERVRQIQVEALRGLRDILRNQGLTSEVVFAEMQSRL